MKEPLGSGKSFQARRLQYERICWLTSSRTLAQETATLSGFENYQEVEHSTPLSWIDKVVVLAPSLYRLWYKFKPFDCLIIDECESFFHDLFSGLCRGSNFELGMQVLERLMNSKKVLFLDGYLKNSSLSVACSFASALEEIRLVISTYKIPRGSLWELPPPLRWSKKDAQAPNDCSTIEGLMHLIAENEDSDAYESLNQKLYEGSLFWRVKVSLLEDGYNIGGPVNSVSKFTSFAANNLYQYNR